MGTRRDTLVIRHRADRTVLAARGPIGRHDLEAFEVALRDVIDAGQPTVVIDLRRAPTVDLPVVAAVLRAERELRGSDRELAVLSADRAADPSGVACV